MRGLLWMGLGLLVGCVDVEGEPAPEFASPLTAAGESRTCVADGESVYVRGEDRARYWYPVPRALDGVSGAFIDLSCRDAGGCGLTEDGTVSCWQDERGVYAMDTWTLSVPGATRVARANDIVCVTAGDDLVCDITETPGWGYPFSALGVGEVVVPDIVGPTAVALSELHGCAIDQDGDVWCFGLSQGQLPTDTSGSVRPQHIDGVEDALTVSVSDGLACALTGAGEAWCWGGNWRYNEPSLVAERVVAVIATPLDDGDDRFSDTWCTLDAFGRAECGSRNHQRSIANLDGLTFDSLTGGNQHACGWSTDGEQWCWGHGVVEPGVWSQEAVRVDDPIQD